MDQKDKEILNILQNNGRMTASDLSDKIDLSIPTVTDRIRKLSEYGYLQEFRDNIENFYNICYKSKRWEKWVSNDFIPYENKEELIKICGHYVLSDKKFLLIKPDIDIKIKLAIKNKLRDLYDV